MDKIKSTPLVSICTLVYNHEQFLKECFEGFLIQKTNFAFEVLVHDDASTDNSVAIIREYTEKYPEIFKPIYQTENQYSKGIKISTTYQFPRAKGKYIAICEGDDYWTDPEKLQKQVDFLEAHPEYIICSHQHKTFNQDTQVMEEDWRGDILDGIHYDLSSLINGKWHHQPLTVMFNTEKINLDDYNKYPNAKDATLFYLLLKNGKGFLMPKTMAFYRVHSNGIWSSCSWEKQLSADFKNRIGIYEIEKSKDAACFIRVLFFRWMTGHWMLREWRLMIKSFIIISKHFGIISTYKLFKKAIAHKN